MEGIGISISGQDETVAMLHGIQGNFDNVASSAKNAAEAINGFNESQEHKKATPASNVQSQAGGQNVNSMDRASVDSFLTEQRKTNEYLAKLLESKNIENQKKDFDSVKAKETKDLKGIQSGIALASSVISGVVNLAGRIYASGYQGDAASVRSLAQGDALQAKESKRETVASALSGGLSQGSSIVGNVSTALVAAGKALGVAGLVFSAAGGIASSVISANNEAEKAKFETRQTMKGVYQDSLHGTEDFYRAFGMHATITGEGTRIAKAGDFYDYTDKDGKRHITNNQVGRLDDKTNAVLANELYAKERDAYHEKAGDAGLSMPDFLEFASSFAKYGVHDLFGDSDKVIGKDEEGNSIYAQQLKRTAAEQASDMAVQAANFARNTGGTKEQFAQFLGMQFRYANEPAGGNTLGEVKSAALRSGLTNNQVPEFLQSLQGVIQRGIASGYKMSTKEVADNLAYLANRHGNDALWSGEQGAKRYESIAAGIAGAQSLQSTPQILAYQAIRKMVGDKGGSGWLKGQLNENGEHTFVEGADFSNTLALMEKAPTGETLERIQEAFKGAFGDDVDSQIDAIMQLYGLNRTGAQQMYNAMKDTGISKTKAAGEMQDIMSNTKYKSDTTRLVNATEQIRDLMLVYGKRAFDKNVDELMNGTTIKELQDAATRAFGDEAPSGRSDAGVALPTKEAEETAELLEGESLKKMNAKVDAMQTGKVKYDDLKAFVYKDTSVNYDDNFQDNEKAQFEGKMFSTTDFQAVMHDIDESKASKEQKSEMAQFIVKQFRDTVEKLFEGTRDEKQALLAKLEEIAGKTVTVTTTE